MTQNGYDISNLINCSLGILAGWISREADSKAESSPAGYLLTCVLQSSACRRRGRKQKWERTKLGCSEVQIKGLSRSHGEPWSCNAPPTLSYGAGPSHPGIRCRPPGKGTWTWASCLLFLLRAEKERGHCHSCQKPRRWQPRWQCSGVHSGRIT